MRHHPAFLVFAWVAAVASALSPDWFFLGVEKARVTAYILLGFRLISAALVFVLVKGPSDAWVVMGLLAATSVGGLVVSDFLMYRHVTFRIPDWKLSVSEVRQATTIFVAGLGMAMYTALNVVLLGFFVSSADVAQYGAAERLVRTSLLLLAPIGGAVIPRLTTLQSEGKRERARQLLVRATLAGLLPSMAILIALLGFGEEIIHMLYGEQFVAGTVPILHVLAFLVPINVTGSILGIWLMTLRKDKIIVRIVLIAGVANIIFGCLFTLTWGPIGMAWSVLAAEAVGAFCGFIAVRRDARQARAAGEAHVLDAQTPEQAIAPATSSGV